MLTGFRQIQRPGTKFEKRLIARDGPCRHLGDWLFGRTRSFGIGSSRPKAAVCSANRSGGIVAVTGQSIATALRAFCWKKGDRVGGLKRGLNGADPGMRRQFCLISFSEIIRQSALWKKTSRKSSNSKYAFDGREMGNAIVTRNATNGSNPAHSQRPVGHIACTRRQAPTSWGRVPG